MLAAKLSATWLVASAAVWLISVPLTAFYGAVWLLFCWPVLVAAIALWPLLARHFSEIERTRPMVCGLLAVSLVAAIFGAISAYGTLTHPLELLIPFVECSALLLLPRLLWPSLKAGAFADLAAQQAVELDVK